MNDFDDYDDGFDGDASGDDGHDFMDHDSIEDACYDDSGPDDSLDNDSGVEDDQSNGSCEDEFTADEATIFGVGMGFAYEEGLEEGERRRLQREFEKDDNNNFLDE